MQPYEDFAGRAGRFGTVTQPARMLIAIANTSHGLLTQPQKVFVSLVGPGGIDKF